MPKRSTISLSQLKKSACARIPQNQRVFAELDKKPVDMQSENGKIVARHFKKKSKEKDWMGLNLFLWCSEKGMKLMEEYRFHPERKWRADYFIGELKCVIEYEGLFSETSRHTTAKGYSGDTDKYREAAKIGLTVLRYTAMNYKQVLQDLNDLYNQHIKDSD